MYHLLAYTVLLTLLMYTGNLYVCICVCMYIHTYINNYYTVRTYTRTYVPCNIVFHTKYVRTYEILLYVYVRIHTYNLIIYVHTHACIHMYVHTYSTFVHHLLILLTLFTCVHSSGSPVSSAEHVTIWRRPVGRRPCIMESIGPLGSM